MALPSAPPTSPRPTASATHGSGDRREASPARRGALVMLPLLAAYVPFALVIGSLAADHGDALAGWSGSWLIYGGSAHLAALRTLDDAGPVAAIFTGVLVNARLLVYSTSLARTWAGQPRWFRIVAAGLIIDPTWAAVEQRQSEQPAGHEVDLRAERHFFLGAALTLGTTWSAAIAVGAILGTRVDASDLQIAIPLCLLALVGAGIRTAGTRSVMVVAAAVALLAASWPNGTGVLAAVVAGATTGIAIGRRRP
jgi:predicted branched-subunit amino acid permease